MNDSSYNSIKESFNIINNCSPESYTLVNYLLYYKSLDNIRYVPDKIPEFHSDEELNRERYIAYREAMQMQNIQAHGDI